MSDVVWLPNGLIGFRRVWEKPGAEETYRDGAILALRKNGDEVLFAQSDEDSRVAAEWIPMGDFVVNPVAIATEDDFFEDDPSTPASPGSGEEGGEPKGPRRLTGGGGIKRREEKTSS